MSSCCSMLRPILLVLTTVAMAVWAGIMPSASSAAAPNSTTAQIDSNAGEVSAKSMRSVRGRCQQLTEQTGEKHSYGEGVLTTLVDAVPAGEGAINPFDANGFKGYIAVFSPRVANFDRIYITATNERFENDVVELQENRRYAFCYAIERKAFLTINYPETIRLIEEQQHE